MAESAHQLQSRIGRNVLLFQQIEHMLKGLIVYGNFSAYVSEFQEAQKKQYEKVSKHTMGQLVGQFIENTYKKPVSYLDEERMAVENHLSFSFNIESDQAYYERQKQRMAELVAERNELIHHSLPMCDYQSLEKLKAFCEKLDEQADKLKKEVEYLNQIVERISAARKELGEFLLSEEGEKALTLLWLHNSYLVQSLVQYSRESDRADRGVHIGHAGQWLRKHHPDEVEHMKARYGHSKLESLIKATELFDLYDETIRTGGVRPLYKLKASIA
ncbi:OST-HTH/LOTUS domain-containing protein [Endozoicomonas numazuensis]|nr:OST-HTH/LOTUS domain-containing protein [Endozoicomonas numazuensis]